MGGAGTQMIRPEWPGSGQGGPRMQYKDLTHYAIAPGSQGRALGKGGLTGFQRSYSGHREW